MKTFQIGDGATERVGSDCYPYTIIEIVSPRKVILQSDDYRRTDNRGLSEQQDYEYTRDPSGALVIVTYRKDGYWHKQGESMNGRYFSLGVRRAYSDPSF